MSSDCLSCSDREMTAIAVRIINAVMTGIGVVVLGMTVMTVLTRLMTIRAPLTGKRNCHGCSDTSNDSQPEGIPLLSA